MRFLRKLVSFRVARFAVVGLGNTAVNFAVLNLAFYGLHQGKLASSFIATASAVAFSFILNRNFVFRDKSRPAKQLALFIIVTVTGVLLVQNSVYALGLALLRDREDGIISLVHVLSGIKLSNDFIDVNLSNVIASLCVMVWNYNGYRLLVFKARQQGSGIAEDITTEAA